MGLMKRLLGGGSGESKSSEIAQSESSIQSSTVFAPAGGFSPNKPGKFENIRSAPLLEGPRYFTADEADKLEELARQKKAQVKPTETALRALGRVEKADASVQSAYYREYASRVASAELKKITAKQQFATHLHGLRAPYASLGAGLGRAENKATAAVAAIKAGLR